MEKITIMVSVDELSELTAQASRAKIIPVIEQNLEHERKIRAEIEQQCASLRERLTKAGYQGVKRPFQIGDVIAYRSLKPNKPNWVSWEVGDIDGDGFLYESGKSVEERDNIHRDCAFLVKAAEDNR